MKLGAQPPITAGEAAKRLGCHVETIRRQVRSGRLSYAGKGPRGQLLVYVEELEVLEVRSPGRPEKLTEEEGFEELLEMLEQHGVEQHHRGHIEQTIAVPGWDDPLLGYLHFHRLLVQGMTWREAARELELDEETALEWEERERFWQTLERWIKARHERHRRGQFDPDPPLYVPPRRGPAPTPRPEVPAELAELSWDSLPVTKAESVEVVGWLKRGELEIGVPLIVDVARYDVVGFGTAQIARLVERTPRRVRALKKELRETDFDALLAGIRSWNEQAKAKQEHLRREREDWNNAQAWRGFSYR